MINYERILKECFWEYNFTNLDIDKLVRSENEKEKSFLFEKILLNSTNLFNDLKIFELNTLICLIENYKIASFNYDFIHKRKNMVEVYFMGKPLEINELKWIA